MSFLSRPGKFISGNIFTVIGIILIAGGVAAALREPRWTGGVLIAAGTVAIAVNTVVRRKK